MFKKFSVRFGSLSCLPFIKRFGLYFFCSSFIACFLPACLNLKTPDPYAFQSSSSSLIDDDVDFKLKSGLDLSLISPLFHDKSFYPVFPSGTILGSDFFFKGSCYDSLLALSILIDYDIKFCGKFQLFVPKFAPDSTTSSGKNEVCKDSSIQSISYVLPLVVDTQNLVISNPDMFKISGNSVVFTGEFPVLERLLQYHNKTYTLSFISFVTDLNSASQLSAVVEPSDIAKFFALGGVSVADFFLNEVKYVLDLSVSNSGSLQTDYFVASGNFNVSRGIKTPYTTSSVQDGVIVQNSVSFIDTVTSYTGFVNDSFCRLKFNDSSVQSYTKEGYPVQSSISFDVVFPYRPGLYHKIYSYDVHSKSYSLFDILSFGHSFKDSVRVYYVKIQPY